VKIVVGSDHGGVGARFNAEERHARRLEKVKAIERRLTGSYGERGGTS